MLHKIIKRPPLKDVETSFEAINDAIIEHSRWLTGWNKSVVCGKHVPDAYLAMEPTSLWGFGKWYCGKHAGFLEDLPEFLSIRELYKAVHNSVRNISCKANKGEAVTLGDYDAFLESETLFSKTVIALRDDLYRLLFSFDFLTGTLNRQAFLDVVEKEHARIKRTGEPCSIALLDLDHFKEINDRYGHQTGDLVLTHIARQLNDHLRPYDSVGRYGGEEFLICLPTTDTSSAHTILDRLREEIAQQEVAAPESRKIRITASIGIAPMRAEHDLSKIIDHADKALYRAKNTGRNKVEVWKKGS